MISPFDGAKGDDYPLPIVRYKGKTSDLPENWQKFWSLWESGLASKYLVLLNIKQRSFGYTIGYTRAQLKECALATIIDCSDISR